MRKPKPYPLKKAFTLLEMVVVVALVAAMTAIAMPALNLAKQQSSQTQAKANARTLNEARIRAKLKGDTNPVLDGDDVRAAATYLITQNYVTPK
jgi:prepilin-type N-terminal cleavage/methylation domain-containing protein